MYQNSLPDLPSLTQDRYENIFNLYTDENGRYFYNLLQNVIFPQNLPDGFFETYDVVPGDTLPFISYKVFKTINLWWIICLANNIDNPTVKLEPGIQLKILKTSTVRALLQELNT